MNAMHSTKVIQCPLVQTLFRRLSTSDCLAVNSTNSHYGLSKSWDDDKHNLNTVSYNSQRFFLTTDPQPTTFRRRLSSASEHKATINSEMASTSTDSPDSSQRTNRLANEKSPYLKQHMHNPVNWYPWGEEAFERAREENKLIFLSVGYSTCHWCHVMEKESFENDSVADIMNKHFINIKVDREERPDIDKIYMAFVQATTHHGGWPMSVFLTPDLKPVTGGTYFPPENSRYQVGFKTILNKVSKAWDENRDDLIRIGETFINTLQKACDNNLKKKDNAEVPSLNVMNKGCQQYIQNFESEFGGWNEMPKFPQPSNFNFLFHVYARDKESEMGKICYDMSVYTLKKMANGGIYDHIGDGFSRYSVDNKWHVPHFEKMLYDQGQLAVSYCDAYLVTKEESFADVVRGILRYVSRDLSHKEGGFFSAEDADSLPNSASAHKTEGAFYVWDYDEIKRILANKKLKDISYMDIFAHYFNVLPQGNVDKSQDPHGELENKNVLIILGSVANTASNFNITNEEVESVINESKQLLYTAREKRPRPHLDSKIITAWNGLMMSGYAKAGQILKDDAYINRAIQCAKFIRKYMYDERTKMLLRSCYRASNNEIDQVSIPIPGFLDDYAFLVRGLLDLYEATFDTDWLQWAETIQEQQDQLFWDTKSNGYFNSSAGDKNTIMRLKEDQDGAEPSGNSVAAQNLLRIAAYLNRTDMKAKAGEILSVFSDRLEKIPLALPEMMSSLISFHDAPTKVFIAGPADDPQTNALLDVVRARLMPCRTLAVMDGPRGRSALLYNRLEVVSRLKPLAGRPAAYVCRHYQCSMPVTEPTELAEILDQSENTP